MGFGAAVFRFAPKAIEKAFGNGSIALQILEYFGKNGSVMGILYDGPIEP